MSGEKSNIFNGRKILGTWWERVPGPKCHRCPFFYQSAKSKVQRFQKCHVTEFGQTGAEWCVRPVFKVQSPKIQKKAGDVM